MYAFSKAKTEVTFPLDKYQKGIELSEIVNFEISVPMGYKLLIQSAQNDILGQSL